MTQPDLILFTDLDGTLLDHHTYSYAAALPALNALKKHNIPLVLASSKTVAEIAPLRAELGFDHCEAIVENGAGLLPAHSQGGPNLPAYRDIIKALDDLPRTIRAQYCGFHDMSVEAVAQDTGLSLESAKSAKDRLYSEPGKWSGNDAELDLFLRLLAEKNILAKRGGRYLTLSFGGNKAEKMTEILSRYKAKSTKVVSIALGDAPNDIEMLQAADYATIVENGDHSGIPALSGEASGQITRTTKNGPAGWNAAVLDYIARFIPAANKANEKD